MDEPNFEIEDFIGVFPDAVNPDFCDYLVNYIDQSSHVMGGRNYTHVKDKQICLDAFSPGESKNLRVSSSGDSQASLLLKSLSFLLAATERNNSSEIS